MAWYLWPIGTVVVVRPDRRQTGPAGAAQGVPISDCVPADIFAGGSRGQYPLPRGFRRITAYAQPASALHSSIRDRRGFPGTVRFERSPLALDCALHSAVRCHVVRPAPAL